MTLRRINTKGFREFSALLAALPGEIRGEVEEKALRELAYRVLWQAQSRVPVDTGRLRDGLEVRRQPVDGTTAWQVGVRGYWGFIWRYVEGGTAPHEQGRGPLERAVRTVTRTRQGRTRTYSKRTWTRPKQWTHPGARAQPFLEPSFRSVIRRAPRLLKEHIIEATLRAARRAGAT